MLCKLKRFSVHRWRGGSKGWGAAAAPPLAWCVGRAGASTTAREGRNWGRFGEKGSRGCLGRKGHADGKKWAQEAAKEVVSAALFHAVCAPWVRVCARCTTLTKKREGNVQTEGALAGGINHTKSAPGFERGEVLFVCVVSLCVVVCSSPTT